jgi:hypothetical protein
MKTSSGDSAFESGKKAEPKILFSDQEAGQNLSADNQNESALPVEVTSD